MPQSVAEKSYPVCSKEKEYDSVLESTVMTVLTKKS